MPSSGNLWKILACVVIAAVSFVVLVWPKQPGISDLILVTSVDCESQALAKIKAPVRTDEFASLAQRALDRWPWAFGALRDIARENKMDLTKFFPDLNIAVPASDIDRRNTVLIEYLMQQADISVMATLEIPPDALTGLSAVARAKKLEKLVDGLRKRLRALGAARSDVIIEQFWRDGDGSGRLGLTGFKVVISHVHDLDIAVTLQKPAVLGFHKVYNPASNQPVPPDYQPMEKVEEDGRISHYYIKRKPELDGGIMASAGVYGNEYGQPEIHLKFTSDGGQRFYEMTKSIVADHARSGQPNDAQPNSLAIVLDGKLYSVATVRQPIDGGAASISGRFSLKEAQHVAAALNNPLDIPVLVTELREVSVPASTHQLVSGPLRVALHIIMILAALMAVWFVIAAMRKNRRAKTLPPPLPPATFSTINTQHD